MPQQDGWNGKKSGRCQQNGAGGSAVLAAFAFVMMSVPAVAEASPYGCFARAYTAVHLAANPSQQVQRIAVRLWPIPAGSNAAPIGISVHLKGRRQAYGTGGNCTAAPEGWQCRSDTDGEAPFSLQRRNSGLVMALTRRMKVTYFPKGDYPDDLLIGGAADSTFVLQRVPDAACGRRD